ncbi:Aa-trans domain-containing protein [Fusarium falciforme]|uniref:Aa-trans domain-containing protein n=1 Tax=Fusarium falciforme TaxID=195108 RepID=UPI002301F43B|nr:Aa-trans domain-containing protein [Fusarium falciforme]WAO95693.1 Aa-trans domain-containing protein [Fusarium falciforme]
MSALNEIKTDPEGLSTMPSQGGDVHDSNEIVHDAVFGEISDDGPDYRNVGWIGSSVLMMKIQIGLGVLALPAAFNDVGLIPGVILLSFIGGIVTWTAWVVGVFKLRHREVYGIDDAVQLMFGRVASEAFGFIFCLFWVFAAGSGMLGISIGLNAITSHGACTAAFVGLAAFLGFSIASIRTLGRLAWFAWFGLVCLLAAIFTVSISVGVQDVPDAAPQDGDWVSDYKLVNRPTFTGAMNAISTFLMSYSAIPGFFPIAAEMRNPRLYTRPPILCHSVVSIVYIVIGCIVYYYCGSYVSSPALGSAGKLMKKICYGLSLPGLIVTTVLAIHFASKYIFLRILKGTEHINKGTLRHWATWFSCTFGCATVSYIIGSAVPSFGSLASLIGAFFGTLLCIQPMGCMWLYDNWSAGKHDRSRWWMLQVCWSGFVIVVGTIILVGGTYGSVLSIKEVYGASGGHGAFSCADNSHS